MSSVTTHKLADFATILSGYAFDSGCFGETGEIPIIRIRDVVRGYSNTFYTGDFSSNFVINNGDLLVGMDGDFNTAIWQGGKAVLNQRVCKIIPNQKIIDQTYLYYLLPKELKKIWDETSFVTVKHLSVKALQSIEVPLPPLPEQKRIAAILDKADSIRRKRQEAVRLTEELLRSVFLDMFGDPVTNPKGWVTLCMEEIILDGPQNGLYKHESDYGSGTQIVRIDSFYDGEVTGIDKLKRVRLDAGTIQKYQLLEDDILINRVNSRKFLGKSAIVPKLKEPTVFESNMMRIAVNEKIICPHYLVSLLQHQYIKTQIDNKAKDAVNQSSINQDDVKSFEIRVPPLKLQAEFKVIKKKLFGLFIRQSEADLFEKTLFNSILQRAFKGVL